MNQANMEARQAVVKRKPQLPLSAIQRYVLAILSVSLALGLALLMQRLHVQEVRIPLFLFAIAVAAWYGGAASMLALLLSCISFDYFFTEPLHTLSLTGSDLVYFIFFTSFAALVTWFSTVRRRVEGELRQARDQLEIEVAERTQQASLLNLTHDSIFVREMSSVITYWNQGAVELYGWTAEETIGKRSHDLLRTSFPAPLEDIEAELLRTGRWDGELKHTRADGNVVVVSSRWSLRRDEQGQPTVIMETSNDISERKQREQEISTLNEELGKRTAELESSNKELEAFAYSVSHDLRAPLRHMAGFTELLKKHAASVLNEKSQRYVMMILESAKRMGDLIDDLLAFSRIGRAETRQTMVRLEQLVQEVLTELRPDTGGRDIVWKVAELPSAFGDRSMLRVAFVNLIGNAVKFTRTRARAEIEIGCRNQSLNQIVVFVRDNGVGFDMKYANKLFGVFQRLHPAEAFEGTGIGLATVQRIVHRHGGRVWAEAAVDRGATFFFELSSFHRKESNL
jgi:PAS domain S-box-containing protein